MPINNGSFEEITIYLKSANHWLSQAIISDQIFNIKVRKKLKRKKYENLKFRFLAVFFEKKDEIEKNFSLVCGTCDVVSAHTRIMKFCRGVFELIQL